MKYTVKDCRPWKEGGKPIQDDNGEFLMSITLEGHGEPVDYRSRTFPEAGDEIEGTIETYQSSKGNTRQYLAKPFKLDMKQALIMAQWAHRVSVDVLPDHNDLNAIEEYAHGIMKSAIKVAKEFAE